MAKITWLGEGDYKEGETPLSSCTWKGILFTAGDKVEVTDEWMINKARGNRFFRVEDEPAKKPAEPEQSLPIGLIRPEAWTNTPEPEDEPKRRRGRPPRIRDNGNGDQ